METEKKVEEYKAALEEIEKEELIEQSEGLKKLERRLKYRVIDVKFREPDGEFTVKVRPMTLAEERLYHAIQEEILEIPDLERQKVLDEELFKLLGKICLEPEYNYEYWRKGNYQLDFPAKIFVASLTLSFEDEKNIKFFRTV